MMWLTLRKLRSKNVEDRLRALRELGGSTDDRAFEALRTTVLRDPSGAVRGEALLTLSRFGHVSSFDTLIESLRDQDPAIRKLATDLLIDRQDKTEADLRKLLAVDDPQLRRRANDEIRVINERKERVRIELLEREADSKIGVSPKVRSLINELQDNHTKVFSAAARALEKLGWTINISSTNVVLENRGKPVSAGITYDTLVDRLGRIIGIYLLPGEPSYPDDIEEMRWALGTAGRLRCTRLTNKILVSLGFGTNEPVWPQAWAALGSIGSSAVDELATRAANSEAAVIALDRIGSSEAIGYLQCIAVDPKLPESIKKVASGLIASRAVKTGKPAAWQGTETPEAKARRLREEASQPHKGIKIITSGQSGAAYGIQAIDDRAMELIQSGRSARQVSDFNRALSLYRQALTIEPQSVEAHGGLGATHVGLGNIDEAVKEHRLSIQCAPEYIIDKVQLLYLNIAHSILKKGLSPSATIQGFRAATNGLLQSSGYHHALGLLYWKIGDPIKARSEFQEVLKIEPNGLCSEAAREWSTKIDRGEGPG